MSLRSRPGSAGGSGAGYAWGSRPNKVTLIRISDEGEKLTGTVEKVHENDVDGKGAKCVKCNDSLKDKPMAGLRLIWDMKKDGEKSSGGMLLDPESGRIVNCKLETADGGRS